MTSSDIYSPASIVVGVGASAGGVEALCLLLDHDQGQSKAAFIVAMHLSTQKPSHLSDILKRHTRMRVFAAADGLSLDEGAVYVVSPGQIVTVGQGRLIVQATTSSDRTPTVVDRLFDSLASIYADRAIGVVLSGTGTDGALGLKAIKARGGLTIAQVAGTSSPLFAGMPQSAIAAGVIDMELGVEQIAQRLTDVIQSLGSSDWPNELENSLDFENERVAICALMLEQVGHDFSGYKRSTFFRRVTRRMQVLQMRSLQIYLDCLRSTPHEVTLLFRDLLISVTNFFRDRAAFLNLEQDVVPSLFDGKGPNDEVRVWVPGCATGEEAYSLAILLLEHAGKLGKSAPKLRIFATDIDERALHIARRGRYPSVLLDAVSLERRTQFFEEDRENFVVNKLLRSVCTFSVHNVLRDPPFSRIDLVSCRNLLIYLGVAFQDRVYPTFHYALRPDGFLFVGVAEGATRHSSLFEAINKTHRIFRRLATGVPATPPLLRRSGLVTVESHVSARSGSPANLLRQQIEARVIQAYAPPHVLVNAGGNVLFYSSRVEDYLQFAAGAPSMQFLANVKKELRGSLRRALNDVVNSRVPLDLPEVLLSSDDGGRKVQVRIEPFEDREDGPLYLVIFNDRGPAHQPTGTASVEVPVVEQLEQELYETREQLYASHDDFETLIEELRVANEELMSVNEELQSSNEELETSKEELQSINEELQTVNSELTRNVDALDQSNADLRGLLESTQIATIFLDQRFAIRSFTQASTDIFTLIPSDQGRAITDLACQLEDFNLAEILRNTILTRQPFQRPISRKDGAKHYLMRILPYGGVGIEAAGAVLTFVDISPLAEADGRHKVMIGELNHRVRNMLAVVSALAHQTLGSSVEPERLQMFVNRLDAIARAYRLLTDVSWSVIDFRKLLLEELSAVATSNRFKMEGPPVLFAPREAIALGMILHELATNAVKYGALSNQQGVIDVRWGYSEKRDALNIHWLESGGPKVVSPTHRGFGSLLVERQIAYELNGSSAVSFPAEGVSIMLVLPMIEPS